jgi:hypothetical protein
MSAITERPPVRLDGTITYGNLLTLAAIVLSVGIYYGKVERGLKDSEDARVKYVPMIEEADKKNLLQDQSITTILQSVQAMQTNQTDNVRTLGVIQTDIAEIKGALGIIDRIPRPPSTLRN